MKFYDIKQFFLALNDIKQQFIQFHNFVLFSFCNFKFIFGKNLHSFILQKFQAHNIKAMVKL